MEIFSRGQHGVVRTSLITFVAMLWIFTVFVYFIFYNMERGYQNEIASCVKKTKKIKEKNNKLVSEGIRIQSLVGYFCDKNNKVITREKLKGERNKRKDSSDINVDLRRDKKLLKDLNKLNKEVRVPYKCKNCENTGNVSSIYVGHTAKCAKCKKVIEIVKPPKPERGTRLYYGLEEMEFYTKGDNLDEGKLQRPTALNIENALTLFKNRIYDLQAELKRTEEAAEIKQIQIDSEVRGHSELLNTLNGYLDALKKNQDILQEKSARIKTLLSVLEEKIEDSEEVDAKILLAVIKEKEEAVTKSRELNEEILAAKNAFEIEKKARQEKIRELQAKKYGKESQEKQYESEKKRKLERQEYKPTEDREDGTVVLADARANTVYINLGKNAGMVRGLKFDVYRSAKTASKVYKGRIEVQKVMKKVSVAVVLEQSDLDPIVGGDLIVNPVYEKDRSVYFVFTGSFTTPGSSKLKAKKMIEEVGGKVEREVSAKTNFVVVGNRLPVQPEQDPNYRAALNFGITLMPEKALMKYIGD